VDNQWSRPPELPPLRSDSHVGYSPVTSCSEMKRPITAAATIGVLMACLFLAFLERRWFIDAICFRGRTFQVCVIFIPVLAVLALVVRRRRRASEVLRPVLVCVVTFFAISYGIDLGRDMHYGLTRHAQLGTSYVGTASLSHTLGVLEQALTCGDTLSKLDVLDLRDSPDDSTIALSWHAGDKIGTVLDEVRQQARARVEVNVVGNPWCRGTRFGNIYKVTIKETEDVEHSAFPDG